MASFINHHYPPVPLMRIGVIISTYNNPVWLEKALWGYMYQTRKPDEIIIADDGSGQETAELIEAYKQHLPLKHVWHDDDGFRKTIILNKAIASATADYLIFTDQDCVPRRDFVEVHEKNAEKGNFLSGGVFKLPMNISELISRADVEHQNAFSLKWLRNHGLSLNFKCTKLFGKPRFARFMNFITPTKATWNGGASSAWRSDLMAANGYDERMKYGGEDRELGERMMNAGIKSKQIRYSAILLHLHHGRPYANKEGWDINNEIRRHTRKHRITHTPHGIQK